VAGNNIHRDEARERARLLSVASNTVTLDLTTGDETFRSTTEIRFECREPGSSTHVNLTAPRLLEATLNGVELDPAQVFDGNRIALDGLAATNELRVVADCLYMRTGEGLHRFVDPVDGCIYLYSQFETFDAHRMYACFDQPDLKAVFELTVTAPDNWQVVSNMAPAADPSAAGADIATWRFAPSPPMSTYITALIAGPYSVVRDRHGDIDLGLYCRESLARHLDPDELFTVTKQGFEFFQRVFDYPYPFGKYDQLFVPEFNAGAMENAGAVTILEDYVFRSKVTDAAYERRAETVLHEMAHMWFGDLVTMRWWDDLWLNESFATYLAVLCQSEATRFTTAWTTFANVEKGWAYRQDQLPSTHPIAADIEDNEAVKVNFDGITYAKGASVLKQLVAWVGREEFLAGLRSYFRRHEYANTTLADLLSALEESSGRDLTAWSKEWFETAGVNTLRAEFDVDGGRTFSAFALRQEAPEDHPTLRSHRVAIGLYDRTDEGLVRRHRVETDVVGSVTQVPELVGHRQPDVVLVNDDDLTYAKIRLDERSMATVTDSIGHFADSLPRAVCWAASWDMTRDAELAARDYLSLVLAGIARETDVGVVQVLLRQAELAVDYYADPAYRETGHHRLAEAAYAALLSAEPGSDHQLAWARAFAAASTSSEQATILRGMLAGSRPVDGLAIDTELRWLLLRRLVVLGAAGDDEIDAELERDSTAAGERHAAAARAARPTSAAKAEAWSALVESDELPNAVQTATIAGFQQAAQRELLRPYVERYFAVVERLWAERTVDMAQNLVVGLYPALLPEQATLDRTDEFLRTAQPVPALRRLLLEGRDGVARALRAQQRDAAAAG
jgi:aminopeptidase N